MLKKRVAANLVVKDGIVVQSINFNRFLPIGKPAIAIEYLNRWGIDEIILTDIDATLNNRPPDFEMVKNASRNSYVPLTVGGGISHVDHISKLMKCGADKILINQSAINHPEFIHAAAQIFGNQCIVVSIDAINTENGYKVYNYTNKKTYNILPADFARQCEELGAGEIFINSVDRDGSYQGYDIELLCSVCDNVKVPVICCGGARNAKDFVQVFSKTNVSAASAGNFFHFTEHSVMTTKTNIRNEIEVRMDANYDYRENSFDQEMRLEKKPDQILEEMLYVKIDKEII